MKNMIKLIICSILTISLFGCNNVEEVEIKDSVENTIPSEEIADVSTQETISYPYELNEQEMIELIENMKGRWFGCINDCYFDKNLEDSFIQKYQNFFMMDFYPPDSLQDIHNENCIIMFTCDAWMDCGWPAVDKIVKVEDNSFDLYLQDDSDSIMPLFIQKIQISNYNGESFTALFTQKENESYWDPRFFDTPIFFDQNEKH